MAKPTRREFRLTIIAQEALRLWGATIDFNDHSEENMLLIAEFAWMERDLERIVEEQTGSEEIRRIAQEAKEKADAVRKVS